jgi:hypothetical protein
LLTLTWTFSDDLRAVAYAAFLQQQDYDAASDEAGIDLARQPLRTRAARLAFGEDGAKDLLAYDTVVSAHDEGPTGAASVPRNWFLDRLTVPVLDDVRYDYGYEAPCDPSA